MCSLAALKSTCSFTAYTSNNIVIPYRHPPLHLAIIFLKKEYHRGARRPHLLLFFRVPGISLLSLAPLLPEKGGGGGGGGGPGDSNDWCIMTPFEFVNPNKTYYTVGQI